MPKKRIILADDHAIVRDGLKLILNSVPDYEVIGEASNGHEALEIIERQKPDIVVLDISMPITNGIEVARQVRKYWPEIKIIILSRHDNEEYISTVIKLGVQGYILKDGASIDLLNAVSEILKGNVFLSPRIMTKVLTNMNRSGSNSSKGSLFGSLSDREVQVLKLISEGKNTGEIAAITRITVNTVRVHRRNIMEKLNIHKTADLVRYAIKTGLVED